MKKRMSEDRLWANNCVDCGWGFVVTTLTCTCRAGPCSAKRARELYSQIIKTRAGLRVTHHKAIKRKHKGMLFQQS